jgi:ferredoxin-nitrite reductase
LTEDSAENSFEESVSCVGASLCQVGSQDSNGLLHEIVARTRKAGVSSALLPRIHISGCLSSCGTHQIGEIGFHGATKLIDKVPTPSFILVFGGSENFGTERFGMPMGNIIAAAIPDFFVELAELLTRDEAADFRTWQTAHADSFAELVKKYEAIRPQQNDGNRA